MSAQRSSYEALIALDRAGAKCIATDDVLAVVLDVGRALRDNPKGVSPRLLQKFFRSATEYAAAFDAAADSYGGVPAQEKVSP